MSHKLDDITLYYYFSDDNAARFTMKQNVVSDLYVSFLNGYKPPKTSRISVTLSTEDSIRFYFGSILTVDAYFDRERFWTLKDKEQNKLILETVHRIALLCAEKYNWDKKVFELAYHKVLQVDFKYEIEGILKNSNDRQHKASILLQKDEFCSTISVVFYNKEGMKIKSVELLKSFQHVMFYGGIIKNQKWFNNNEFGLYSSSGELSIRASLEKDLSEIIIEPKDNEREVIEGFLRKITYREINNDNDIVEWMNK